MNKQIIGFALICTKLFMELVFFIFLIFVLTYVSYMLNSGIELLQIGKPLLNLTNIKIIFWLLILLDFLSCIILFFTAFKLFKHVSKK